MIAAVALAAVAVALLAAGGWCSLRYTLGPAVSTRSMLAVHKIGGGVEAGSCEAPGAPAGLRTSVPRTGPATPSPLGVSWTAPSEHPASFTVPRPRWLDETPDPAAGESFNVDGSWCRIGEQTVPQRWPDWLNARAVESRARLA